jgi:nucleoside-diphosphate-sugar epimerase
MTLPGKGSSPLKRVVVTGATGYIGYRLTKRLLAEGFQVHLPTRPSSDTSGLQALGGEQVIHLHEGGIESMTRIMESATPDTVFHLAALVLADHRGRVRDLINSNITFGTEILEAIAQTGATRIINTGTHWQHYGGPEYNPVNLYAATKQAFEDIMLFYAESSPLKAVTLKLADVYGPRDPRGKILDVLRKAHLRGETARLTPGEQQLDLIHVDDVAEAFLHAARIVQDDEFPSGARSYGVGSGRTLTLKELVSVYERVTGAKLAVEWGALPYRPREVMVPWQGPPLPGFRARVDIEDGIRRFHANHG